MAAAFLLAPVAGYGVQAARNRLREREAERIDGLSNVSADGHADVEPDGQTDGSPSAQLGLSDPTPAMDAAPREDGLTT